MQLAIFILLLRVTKFSPFNGKSVYFTLRVKVDVIADAWMLSTLLLCYPLKYAKPLS